MVIEISWLKHLDVDTVLFLNRFVGRHPWFDNLIDKWESVPLLKGGLLIVMVWALLFDRKRPNQLREDSDILLGSLFFAMLATLAARCLALCLPFRARPLADPSLHFHIPGHSGLMLSNWSSFPSDHAAIFTAVACGIFFVSRRLGWFAFAWVVIAICIPRLYMGVHWPTDLLGGICLGLGFAQFARAAAVRARVRRIIGVSHGLYPDLFFAALFVWSYELVDLFDDARHLLRVVVHAF